MYQFIRLYLTTLKIAHCPIEPTEQLEYFLFFFFFFLDSGSTLLEIWEEAKDERSNNICCQFGSAGQMKVCCSIYGSAAQAAMW